jgi:hypothetical protein
LIFFLDRKLLDQFIIKKFATLNSIGSAVDLIAM